MKTVTFPRWPTWNFQFPERDVVEINAVRYHPAGGGEQQTYPSEKVRLATGHNGVCAIVFKEKHALPPTAERADAVTVEYEPPAAE